MRLFLGVALNFNISHILLFKGYPVMYQLTGFIDTGSFLTSVLWLQMLFRHLSQLWGCEMK